MCCNIVILKTNRLFFIDAVRAYAILMMLQGHFTDTLLAVSYRNSNNLSYTIWEYFRGNTAPTFFTVSGLIFTYLLLKAEQSRKVKQRIRKGLFRGLMLVGIGYALRIPFFSWLYGDFNTYFLVVDVLQCIGISLILVILIYKLVFKNTLVFAIVTLIVGLLIFITEPLYRTLELPNIPVVFSNYFSKSNGSIFTLIPWFGFMALGAFMATVFYKFLRYKHFKIYAVSCFIVFGLLLMFTSSWCLHKLNSITDWVLLKNVANYNYLFIRFGNVLVTFGVFYALEFYIKNWSVFLKIGQKTLSIYVIHFIIIYGSFTGYGLHQIIGKSLNPWQIICGAVLFLCCVCVISLNYVKTNTFVYHKIRGLFKSN